MGYQTIEVRKLSPVIGAEIFGVDLARPLGNQVFQEIHDALMDNLVIFFRDQELTLDVSRLQADTGLVASTSLRAGLTSTYASYSRSALASSIVTPLRPPSASS